VTVFVIVLSYFLLYPCLFFGNSTVGFDMKNTSVICCVKKCMRDNLKTLYVDRQIISMWRKEAVFFPVKKREEKKCSALSPLRILGNPEQLSKRSSTVQVSRAKYTEQHSTVQYSIVQHSHSKAHTAQRSTA
jgi:hypothetical protein